MRAAAAGCRRRLRLREPRLPDGATLLRGHRRAPAAGRRGRARPRHRTAARHRARAAGLRHAIAPVPARRRTAHRPPPATAAMGPAPRCLDRRGRLRRRIPLRTTSHRRLAIDRHRWPGDLCRHRLQGPVATSAARLHGAAAPPRRGVPASQAAGRPARAGAGPTSPGVTDR
ncbi:Uncharacterised protein [Bordetella pertussis]|nr:Uncharacterised protein [Bordetella pertussis]